MGVDHCLYEAPGDPWWPEDAPLGALRTMVNPGRLAYLARTLRRHGLDPRGLRALDVGCGGGVLAEELARLGCRVTGVDPAGPSLAVARAHAAGAGLAVDLVRARGEALPLADGSFDLVVCCDVLEHVDDVDLAVAEAARALRPGGVYLFDTINRTLRSRLVAIWLLQEWGATRVVPPRLHDWRRFVRPDELAAAMARHGLRLVDSCGLAPPRRPLALARLLRQVHTGRITQAEAGRRAPMRPVRDRSILYAGHAVKAG